MSSWYPVPQNPTHGIFVQRHARAVSRLHDVCVVYCTGVAEEASDTFTNEENFREYIRFYDKRGLNGFQKFFRLRKLYDETVEQIIKQWGKPDVIHLNVVFPAGIFALRLSKKHKIPLVITEHWTGYLPEDGSYRGFVKKWVTKKIVAAARIVSPVTHHLANAMRNHGLQANYKPVPNVVDTDLFSPAETKTNGAIAFLHLSSFDERQKNPKSVIEAFLKLNNEFSETTLVMAGDGDNIEKLEKYAAEKGIAGNGIQFIFRPQGKDLVNLFHRANALVLNSNYENLPVVILEAMSCGLPVISSAVGGISEYVNEKNGILFSPPSTENLYSAMKKFILKKESFDRKFIRSFAVENFSNAVIARRYEEIYNTITN
jgi:glycosyltransferase involved in cell wall biosynthesis